MHLSNVCSTMKTMVEENDQRPSWDDEHSPGASPTPPEPPDKPAQRCSNSPSIELEGERTAAMSYDVKRTRGDTVVLGVLAGTKETRKQLTKLQNASEELAE